MALGSRVYVYGRRVPFIWASFVDFDLLSLSYAHYARHIKAKYF